MVKAQTEVEKLKADCKRLRQKVSRMEGELREQRDKKVVESAMRAYYGRPEWYK